MFPYVYSLLYVDTDTLAPSFVGSQLLKECINLRHVWLTLKIEDLPSVHRYKQTTPALPFLLDKKAFLEAHSFRQILALKHIEKVS